MSAEKSDGNQPRLDLAEVRRLGKLMESMSLAEVEIDIEGKRVRVVRAVPGMQTGPLAMPMPMPMAGYAPALPAAQPTGAPAAAPAAGGQRGAEIPSPMVGTFYRSPSPDAAPFSEVGDRITKDSVVCIIEAMKVMNEIKAEIEGEILEILVQNGEPVEFGQPLFLVRPTGGGGV